MIDTQLLIGAIGALAVVGLLVGGIAIGWRAHARFAVQKTREKATDDELKRAKEQDDAFHSLTGYSVEQAYGYEPLPVEGSENR